MTLTSTNPWDTPVDHETREQRRLCDERYAMAVEHVEGVVYEPGCGHGYGTARLAASPRVIQVIARDVEPEAITVAMRHQLPKVNLGIGNVEQLPVPPCDWVVCLEVMEHLYEPEKFLVHCKLAVRHGIALSWPVGKPGNLHDSCAFAPGDMSKLMADFEGRIKTLHEKGPGGRVLTTYEAGAFTR